MKSKSKLKVYELQIKVYLLKRMKMEDTLYSISKLISGYMSLNEGMLELHSSDGFKPYSFDSLYPIEKGDYMEDRIYSFRIRSIDSKFVSYFLEGFEHYSDKNYKVLRVGIRELKKRSIEKVWSLTPLILKTEKGYWKNSLTLEDFEARIIGNLEKKYKFFVGDLDDTRPFYDSLSFMNQKPLALKYKGIKILGDKIELQVGMDERSQNLAYLALGLGLGEMGASLGTSFLGYKLY